MVSDSMQILHCTVEPVESVTWIEKKEILVYSMDSGISLKRKVLPEQRGSTPFFGTRFSAKRLCCKEFGSAGEAFLAVFLAFPKLA